MRALRADPGVTTLSPWDRGDVARLRPSPRRALIVADFHVGIAAAVNDSVPDLDRMLAENVRPPVRATQTGYATLSRAIQEESISAAERGELIALPILLLVLLLVFRSPVAAASRSPSAPSPCLPRAGCSRSSPTGSTSTPWR